MPDSQNQAQDFENGVITAVQNGHAIVQLNLQPACENCGAKVLCVPDADGKRQLKVSNPLHAQVGNRVAIGESSDFLLKISAIQYGIPFIGFLAGIFIAYFLDISVPGLANELIYFSAGLVGLGIAAFISRNLAQRLAENNQSFFMITRILNSN